MRDIRKLIFQLHMLGLAGKFFAVSGTVSCSDVAERWCEISPALAYTTLNIDQDHSKMINCTIPSTSGSESSTVNFVNQFGNLVANLPNADLYPPVIDDSRSPAVSNYRIGIRWTSDNDIREQLKIIQCVANFECSSRPFKTSVISLNFLDNGEGSTEPATESTTVPQTTQNLIASTTRETSTTTRANSGCVCTPSQCATVVPDIENFIQPNQTNHGFKTSYTLNFSLFSAIILLTLLCIS